MDTITWFRDHHEFLSNFHTGHGTVVDGRFYATVEHHFQAAKFTDPEVHGRIAAALTPREAKARGRQTRMSRDRRREWDDGGAETAMYRAVAAKFTQHDDLRALLLATDAVTIVEGNRHHDQIWGDCFCGRDRCARRGDNKLGIILERVRDELRTT